MEQFIRYLYEYRNGQPSRNVGFVKVEKREEQTTVHIHGKGLQLGNETELTLYLFYMEQNTPIGIPQGVIRNINPAVNYRLIFNGEDTGRPANYPLVRGILMESAGKRRFAATWSDMPLEVEKMRIWQEPEVAPVTMTEAVREAAVQGLQDAGASEEPEDVAVETVKEPEDAAVEIVKEPEDATVEAVKEPEDAVVETAKEPVSEQEIDAYIPPSRMQCKKIRRQDIAMLPRCEWRLANNSFLLHGYYNYHHLILIEQGDELWLGVPGIYHRREARAAEAFGFVRFVSAQEGTPELAEDEKEKNEDFGYWCRRVRHMSSRTY